MSAKTLKQSITVWLLALVLLSAASQRAAADDPGFEVLSGEVYRRNGDYYLNAEISYRLSDIAREALANGVPLVVELELEVRRERWWWLWDEVVAQATPRYRVQYHALSERYLLTPLNNGESRSFRTLRALLDALGHVRELPVIDGGLLSPDERYTLLLRAALDLDALPRPLHTLAYVSPGWRLMSDWKTWDLDS